MSKRVCRICGLKIDDTSVDMLAHLSWNHDEVYTKIWNLLSENFNLEE